MASETKDQNTKLTYDDRKKELTQVKTQIVENRTDPVKEGKTEQPKLLSTLNHKMTAVYTEEGIKLAHKNLSNQRTSMENRLPQLKKQVEGQQDISEEAAKLRELLKELQKSDAAEKVRLEYEDLQKELKTTKKELEELKSIIGTRLKL